MRNGFRAAAAAILTLCVAGAAAAEGVSGPYLAGRIAAQRADVDAAGRYFSKALARDRDNTVIMEQTVVYQAAAGRVDQAIPIARRLAEHAPSHRMSNLLLTVDAFKRGDHAGAIERISTSPEAYHPLVGALLDVWARHGAGEDAEAALSDLSDRAIFRIFGGYHRGLIRAATGDLAGAAEAYEAAMRDLSKPTGRMALAYGAVLRMQGEDDKARQLYEDAIGVSVGDPSLEAEIDAIAAGIPAKLTVTTPAEGAAEALHGLASALSQDGEGRLSLFYARLALYLAPEFDDAALLAAEILEDQEQYRLAAEAYRAVPAASPLSRIAEIGRAEALIQMKEEDRAVEALTALTRRAPDAIDAQLALGDLMRRLERYDEASEAYDRAVKLMEVRGRENWVLYYQRGVSYERAGRWELAEADLKRALELKPDQPLVLNYLGYTWLDMGMNVEEALGLIRKALDQRPEDGYIVDSLGWGYYLLGEYESAVRELERAVELRPVDAVINDHLGDALWQVGRRIEAEFQWRRAMSFDPDETDLTRIKRKLKVGLDQVLAEERADRDEKKADLADGG